MILIVSAVLGSFVMPEKELRYYHLFSPVIIAGLCVLPTFLTYFKKEPTLAQHIIHLILELVAIEIIVLNLVSPPADMDIVLFRVILGIAVFVIYVLAEFMMWLQKYLQSKELTEQLKRLQSSERS